MDRIEMGDDELSRAVHAVELLVWAVLVGLSLATLTSTYGATFPARERALIGEAVVLVLALALTVLSVRRYRGRPRGRAGVNALAATARVVVGAPILLFALVVAAAGFSA